MPYFSRRTGVVEAPAARLAHLLDIVQEALDIVEDIDFEPNATTKQWTPTRRTQAYLQLLGLPLIDFDLRVLE